MVRPLRSGLVWDIVCNIGWLQNGLIKTGAFLVQKDHGKHSYMFKTGPSFNRFIGTYFIYKDHSLQ